MTHKQKTDYKKELEEEKKKSQEYLDSLQRLQAEFENFKKRIEKEQLEFMRFSNYTLIKKLLPLLDSIEEALKHIKDNNDSQGIKLLLNEFKKILQDEGLKEIKSIGEKFDPYCHEGILKEQSDKDDGIILEELQKGYMLYDKLIRASKVKISERKKEITEEKQSNHNNGGSKNVKDNIS